MMKESLDAADEVLEHMNGLTPPVDLTAHRDTIAKEVFDDGLLRGNWDSATHVDGYTIRAINEDEYDQHMPESEKPDWDKMAFHGSLGYVWITRG